MNGSNSLGSLDVLQTVWTLDHKEDMTWAVISLFMAISAPKSSSGTTNILHSIRGESEVIDDPFHT